MVRRALFFSAIVLMALCGLSACGKSLLLKKMSVKRYLDTTNFFEKVPFKGLSKHIEINVYLGDSEEPVGLVWDTGANYSVLTKSTVKGIEAHEITRIRVSDIYGNVQRQPLVLLSSLRIGGVTFKNTIAVIVDDFTPDSPLYCIAPNGILGSNVMQMCHWKVDYEDSTFTITDDWSRFTEMEAQEGYEIYTNPFTGAMITGIKADTAQIGGLTVDSGFGGHVAVNEGQLANDSAFWQNRKVTTTQSNASFGLFGANTSTYKTALIDTLVVANQELYNVPIEVEPIASVLGNVVLSYFDTYFNFKEERIYLVPNSKERFMATQNTFGLTAYYASPEYFIIKVLTQGSAAADAGLQLGDTITHINNKRPADMFNSYCHFLLDKDWLTATDTATFLKKGASQPVTLVKRPAFK